MKTLLIHLSRQLITLATFLALTVSVAAVEPSVHIVFTKLKTPAGKFSKRITFSIQHLFAEGDLRLPATVSSELKVTRFEVDGESRPYAIGETTVDGKKWKVLSLVGNVPSPKPKVDVEAEYVFAELNDGFDESYELDLDRSRLDLFVTMKNGSGFNWSDAATTVVLLDDAGNALRLVYEGKIGQNLADAATSSRRKIELAVDVEPNVAFVELKPGVTTTNSRIVRLASRAEGGRRSVVPPGKLKVKGKAPGVLPEVQTASALTLSGCRKDDNLDLGKYGTDQAFLPVGVDLLTVTPSLQPLAAWLPLGKFEDQFLFLNAQSVELCVENQGANERAVQLYTTTDQLAVFAPRITALASASEKFESVWLFNCDVQKQAPVNLKPDLEKLRANLNKVLELPEAERQRLEPLLKAIARSDAQVAARLKKDFDDDVGAFYEDVVKQLDELINPANASTEARRETNRIRASYAALRQFELTTLPRPGDNRTYIRPVAFECHEDKLRLALADAVKEERRVDACFMAAVLRNEFCAVNDCPLLGSKSEPKSIPFIPLSFSAKRGWKITPPPHSKACDVQHEAIDDGPRCDSYVAAAMPSSQLQVGFLTPEGAGVRWKGQDGKFIDEPLVVPARHNFPQPGIYQLKLTDLPGRPGVELYPTIEIAPVVPRTQALLTHTAIPVLLTDEDFDHVLLGKFFTKVVYLADSGIGAPRGTTFQILTNTQFDRGEDPIAEADRKGTIVAIIRIGNKDFELSEAP